MWYTGQLAALAAGAEDSATPVRASAGAEARMAAWRSRLRPSRASPDRVFMSDSSPFHEVRLGILGPTMDIRRAILVASACNARGTRIYRSVTGRAVMSDDQGRDSHPPRLP